MDRILFSHELMHHGVKGMKWGVRKDRSISGRSIGKAAKSAASSVTNRAKNITGSRSSKALKAARKKNIDEMSNQELQEVINRLNLERNYRSLTKTDYMRGQKYVADALKYENTYNAAKKSATVKAAKKVLTKAV